jgi:hypothetical protein
MLRLILSASCLALVVTSTALAGPMPTLPELPPLPSEYETDGGTGFYIGVLSGYADGPETGLGLSLVVGCTVNATTRTTMTTRTRTRTTTMTMTMTMTEVC